VIIAFIASSARALLIKHETLCEETTNATLGFLPCDASAERGNATVSRPSVCL